MPYFLLPIDSDFKKSSFSCGDITSGLPGEFKVVFIDMHGLLVAAFHFIAIGETPFTLTLRLIVVESAGKARSIGVHPLARNHLAFAPFSYKLLSCLEEDESAAAFFLASAPGARINVFVVVLHDAFTFALALGPVAVIHTDAGVDLFADAALFVVLPAAVVFCLLIFFFNFGAQCSECIGALTAAALKE